MKPDVHYELGKLGGIAGALAVLVAHHGLLLFNATRLRMRSNAACPAS
jgi:hypothetical protein